MYIFYRALVPAGTDLVAGIYPLRAEILQLFFGNLRHIADDMSRRGAVGVDTLRLFAYDHAEVHHVAVLLHLLWRGAVGQCLDGAEVVGRLVVLDFGADFRLGQAARLRQSRDSGL